MGRLNRGRRTLVYGCWNFGQKVSISLTFRAVKRACLADDREPQLVWLSEDRTWRSTEEARDTRRETGFPKSLTESRTDVQYSGVVTALLIDE
jgi:hypothetical protein